VILDVIGAVLAVAAVLLLSRKRRPRTDRDGRSEKQLRLLREWEGR
jgi:hypothetical protein